MPGLSENDPEPTGRAGPPVWLVAAIVLVVVVMIALHLSGVVGSG
jgi:hypothetical protein